MTKTDFVEMVQKKGEYETKSAAERAVKAFTSAITDALKEGESVSLVGFATFSVVDVPEKRGKIPNTDQEYVKPAHKAPKIKAGKTLKDAVANA